MGVVRLCEWLWHLSVLCVCQEFLVVVLLGSPGDAVDEGGAALVLFLERGGDSRDS